MPRIYFALQRDEGGYPPFEEEELGADLLPGNRARVSTIPVFVPSLAVGDVVEVQEQDGMLWGTRVVEESDHWLARLIPHPQESGEHVAEVFRSMGCNARYSDSGLVVVDVAPEIDVQHVLDELDRGGAEGEWEWEMPVAPKAAKQ